MHKFQCVRGLIFPRVSARVDKSVGILCLFSAHKMLYCAELWQVGAAAPQGAGILLR